MLPGSGDDEKQNSIYVCHIGTLCMSFHSYHVFFLVKLKKSHSPAPKSATTAAETNNNNNDIDNKRNLVDFSSVLK